MVGWHVVSRQMTSPGSEHAQPSELSDAITADTASFVRSASEPTPHSPAHYHQLQRQQAIVIVEEPPTPATQPAPPTSLPLSDSQSAAHVRSTDRSSPRLPVATVTSDSLPPVAEESIVIVEDDVFLTTADNDDETVEMKPQTGLNAFFCAF